MASEKFEYFADCDRISCPAGATDYDPQTAWWMAQCSMLTYETKPKVRRDLKTAGFERVFFFDNRGTQGFLALHPGQGSPFAVVAFRGTEKNYLDIVTDILILKTKLPDAEEKPPLTNTKSNPELEAKMEEEEQLPPGVKLFAHGGFMEAFLWVWGTALPDKGEDTILAEWVGAQGISNLIRDHIRNTKMPLYITGHSLGGALATLTAYHALVHYDNVQLYTFGCPRVANRQLAEQIDAKLAGRSHRCVHGWDIVPRIPPLFSYHHTEKLVFFNRQLQEEDPKSRQFTDTLIMLMCLLETLMSTAIAILLFPIPNRLEAFLIQAFTGEPGRTKLYVPITTADHRIACYINAVETQLRKRGVLPQPDGKVS